jgi:multicomponent Na+:H+ antiporter subunit F
MLDEGYLVDIAIIYAMLSFLAVVVLVKVFIGIYMANRKKRGGGQ